jgi:hypothetical protein
LVPGAAPVNFLHPDNSSMSVATGFMPTAKGLEVRRFSSNPALRRRR